MRELSDAEREQVEETWEELNVSVEVLLAQLLAEQQRTNMLLEELVSDGAGGDSGGPSMYECSKCSATVKEDERERHASGRHNAPGDMVESLFEEV